MREFKPGQRILVPVCFMIRKQTNEHWRKKNKYKQRVKNTIAIQTVQ